MSLNHLFKISEEPSLQLDSIASSKGKLLPVEKILSTISPLVYSKDSEPDAPLLKSQAERTEKIKNHSLMAQQEPAFEGLDPKYLVGILSQVHGWPQIEKLPAGLLEEVLLSCMPEPDRAQLPYHQELKWLSEKLKLIEQELHPERGEPLRKAAHKLWRKAEYGDHRWNATKIKEKVNKLEKRLEITEESPGKEAMRQAHTFWEKRYQEEEDLYKKENQLAEEKKKEWDTFYAEINEKLPSRLNPIAIELMEKVYQLEVGESFTCESGGSNKRKKGGGHEDKYLERVYFRFTRESKESFSLFIANGGCNTEELIVEVGGQRWHAPNLYFQNIPESALFFNDALDVIEGQKCQPDFFFSLLEVRLLDKSISPLLFSLCELWKGYRVSPSPSDAKTALVPSKAQTSWAALKRLWRLYLKDDYKKQVALIKLKTLVAGCQFLKEANFSHKEPRQLWIWLTQSVKNLRSYLFPIRQEFSEEAYQVFDATLLDISDTLKALHQTHRQWLAEHSEEWTIASLGKPDIAEKENIYWDIFQELKTASSLETSAQLSLDALLAQYSPSVLPDCSPPTAQTVRQWLAALVHAVSTSHDPDYQIHLVEKCVGALPIPSDSSLWNQIPHTEKLEVITSLGKLLTSYDKAKRDTHITQTTLREQTTVFALYAMIHALVLSLNKEELQTANFGFPGIVFEKNPYTLYSDPLLFQRKEELVTYFRRSYKSGLSLFNFDHLSVTQDFFVKIFEQHPPLQRLLEKKEKRCCGLSIGLEKELKKPLEESLLSHHGFDYLVVVAQASFLAQAYSTFSVARQGASLPEFEEIYLKADQKFSSPFPSDSGDYETFLRRPDWMGYSAWKIREPREGQRLKKPQSLRTLLDSKKLSRWGDDPFLFLYKLLSYCSTHLQHFQFSKEQQFFDHLFWRQILIFPQDMKMESPTDQVKHDNSNQMHLLYSSQRKLPFQEALTQSSFVHACQAFIHQGIEYFHLKQPSHQPAIFPLLFFFRFACRLKRWNSEIHIDRTLLKKIPTECTLTEAEKSALSLHLILSYEHETILSEKEKQELLEAWVYYKLHPLPQELHNPQLEEEVLLLWQRKGWALEAQPESWQRSCLHTLVSHFVKGAKETDYQIHIPLAHVLVAQLKQGGFWAINLFTGMISSEIGDLKGSQTPILSLQMQSMLQDVCGKEERIYTRIGDYFYFSHKRLGSLRLVPATPGEFWLERYISGAWHRYLPKRLITATGFSLSAFIEGHHWWSRLQPNGEIRIYDEEQTKCVATLKEGGELLVEEQKIYLLPTNSIFSKIEKTELIQFLVDKEGNKEILFPLYRSPEGKRIFFKQEGENLVYGETKYLLDPEQLTGLLGEKDHYLVLRHRHYPKKKKVILPLKPVLFHHKSSPLPYLHGYKLSSTEYRDHHSINSTGPCPLIEYRLDGDELEPLTQEGRLHLVYLYLVLHRFTEARQLLSALDSKETLSDASQKILGWIFDWQEDIEDECASEEASLRMYIYWFCLSYAAHHPDQAGSIKNRSPHPSVIKRYFARRHKLPVSMRLCEEQEELIDPKRAYRNEIQGETRWYTEPQNWEHKESPWQKPERTIPEPGTLDAFYQPYLHTTLRDLESTDPSPHKWFSSADAKTKHDVFKSHNPTRDVLLYGSPQQKNLLQFRWVLFDNYSYVQSGRRYGTSTMSRKECESFSHLAPSISLEPLPEKQVDKLEEPFDPLSFSQNDLPSLISPSLFEKHFKALPPEPQLDISLNLNDKELNKEEKNYTQTIKAVFQAVEEDYQAGVLQSKKAIHYACTEGAELMLLVDKEVTELTQESQKVEQVLLELANTLAPEERTKHARLAAQFEEPFTTKKLIYFFLRGDRAALLRANSYLGHPDRVAAWAKQCGIPPEEMTSSLVLDYVYHLTALYLTLQVRLQQLQRAQSAYEDLGKAKDGLEQKACIQRLAMELKPHKKPIYSSQKYPLFLVFEFMTNKTLRRKQVKKLETLFTLDPESETYQECVSELIMGGGKTAIISALVTIASARFGRLACLMVPSSQYLSVKANLGKVMREFDMTLEELNCTREALTLEYTLEIEKQLRGVMKRGNFILVTPEMIQCLVLEFLTLVYEGARKKILCDEELRHINALRRILLIFRQNTDVLADEAHVILDVMHAENFPIGKAEPLKWSRIQLVRTLFALFGEMEDQIGLRENKQTMLSLTLLHGEIAKKVAEKLASQEEGLYLKELPGFWHSFYRYISGEMHKPILQKMLDRPDDNHYERWKASLNLQDLDDLAFLQYLRQLRMDQDENKQEAAHLIALTRYCMTKILPSSFKKQGGRHFGLNHTAERAVPLYAAGIPTENTYSNPYEELIYWYILSLQQGIVKEQLLVLAHFYCEAINDKAKGMKTQEEIEKIEEMREFKKWMGVSPYELGLPGKVEQALTHIHSHPEFFLEIAAKLASYTLTSYPSCMTATQVTLYNAFHWRPSKKDGKPTGSMRVLSGTPWQHKCYPGKLSSLLDGDVGVGGRVIYSLLKRVFHNPEKQKYLHLVKEEPIEEMISKLVTNAEPELRMIIDAGGLFKHAKSNFEVACAIRKATHRPVFFFTQHPEAKDNTPNSFALLPLDSDKVIFLQGTDEEAMRQTKVDLKECYVYIDDIHSFATDVKLPPNTHAYLTVDETYMLYQALQASFRLRQLLEMQQIKFVLPETILQLFPSTEDPEHTEQERILEIFRLSAKNQAIKLAQHFFEQCKQTIDEIFREELLERLLAEELTHQSIKQRIEPYEEIVVKTQQDLPYDQYGALSSPIKSFKALEIYKNNKLTLLKNKNPPQELLQEIEVALHVLFEQLKDSLYLPRKILELCKDGENLGMSMQLQLDNRQELNLQQDQDNQYLLDLRFYNRQVSIHLKEDTYWSDWDLFLLCRSLHDPQKRLGEFDLIPLKDLFQKNYYPYRRDYTEVFQSHLLVTQDFAQTTRDHLPVFHTMQRPCEQLLIVATKAGGYRGLLLGQSEAETCKQSLNNYYKREDLKAETSHFWLVQLDGTPFEDNPHGMLPEDPEIARLLLEANVLAADIPYLIAHEKETALWLSDPASREAKLSFLKVKVADTPAFRDLMTSHALFDADAKQDFKEATPQPPPLYRISPVDLSLFKEKKPPYSLSAENSSHQDPEEDSEESKKAPLTKKPPQLPLVPISVNPQNPSQNHATLTSKKQTSGAISLNLQPPDSTNNANNEIALEKFEDLPPSGISRHAPLRKRVQKVALMALALLSLAAMVILGLALAASTLEAPPALLTDLYRTLGSPALPLLIVVASFSTCSFLIALILLYRTHRNRG